MYLPTHVNLKILSITKNKTFLYKIITLRAHRHSLYCPPVIHTVMPQLNAPLRVDEETSFRQMIDVLLSKWKNVGEDEEAKRKRNEAGLFGQGIILDRPSASSDVASRFLGRKICSNACE